MARSVVVLDLETVDRRLAHREKSHLNLNSGLVVRSNRGNTKERKKKQHRDGFFGSGVSAVTSTQGEVSQ